jgi:hypothetical protein
VGPWDQSPATTEEGTLAQVFLAIFEKERILREKRRTKMPVQILSQLEKPLKRLFDPKNKRGFKENRKNRK